MTTYIFNEAGCIPGIPGTFAGCRVDVDEEGKVHIMPLMGVPFSIGVTTENEEFTPTVTSVIEPPEEPVQEPAPQEQPVETSDSPPLGG